MQSYRDCPPAVFFSNVWSSQVWARLNPGAPSFNQVSYVNGQNWSAWAILGDLTGDLAGCWIGSRESGTQISTLICGASVWGGSMEGTSWTFWARAPTPIFSLQYLWLLSRKYVIKPPQITSSGSVPGCPYVGICECKASHFGNGTCCASLLMQVPVGLVASGTAGLWLLSVLPQW